MTTEIQAFDPLKSQVANLVSPVKTLKVIDDVTDRAAMATLSQVKSLSNAVDAKRIELVKPMNDQVKRINAYAGELSAPLEEAERHLKNERKAFAIAEDKKKAEALAKLQAEEKAAQAEVATEKRAAAFFGASPAPVASEAKVEQIQNRQVAVASAKPTGMRKDWIFKITDPAQVPREFLVVDESKIRAAVKAGARQIAGVEIFEDFTVIGR